MRIFITILSMLLSTMTFAQEMLVGLEINPVVVSKYREIQAQDGPSYATDTIPMLLPFYDDFTEPTVFPSPLRWIDKYAFVNTDIPLFPVNLGGVTLDAISDSGKMYSNAVPGPEPFIADLLTSRYIRLDSVFTPVPRAITPADSIYLSFYYQPQGRGRPPQEQDSLILDFLLRPAHDTITETDTLHIPDIWERAWATKGMPIDTFYQEHNQYFVRVMIPITQQRFLKKNFRFQFYNWVSLASSAEPSWQSNTDQWNIDQVYLNTGRSAGDTVIPQITFIERPPSLLKNYAEMPYPQYSNDPTNEIQDTLNILISNRDIVSHNSNYKYTINDPNGTFSKTYNGGDHIINPFYSSGYVTYIPFAHPPMPFIIPIGSADSAAFSVTHYVKAVDGSGYGDTIAALQKFYNYYAYDDGTPDAGYGLTPTGSKLAYRFKLNKMPDTLRAVQIYFNRTLSSNNQQFFYLCVWNDIGGKPGDTIFSELVYVRFADSLNQFVTYRIDPGLPITGAFFVGTIQTTDDNLNIGFDRYNNSSEDIFYNSAGTWYTSAFSGSLMMRPLVGKPITLGVGDRKADDKKLLIFPNPVSSGVINIRLEGTAPGSNYLATITDMTGRTLIQADPSARVDVSGLAAGVYLVTLTDDRNHGVARGKFIVTR
jgi:hypothetical protein